MLFNCSRAAYYNMPIILPFFFYRIGRVSLEIVLLVRPTFYSGADPGISERGRIPPPPHANAESTKLGAGARPPPRKKNQNQNAK